MPTIFITAFIIGIVVLNILLLVLFHFLKKKKKDLVIQIQNLEKTILFLKNRHEFVDLYENIHRRHMADFFFNIFEMKDCHGNSKFFTSKQLDKILPYIEKLEELMQYRGSNATLYYECFEILRILSWYYQGVLCGGERDFPYIEKQGSWLKEKAEIIRQKADGLKRL